MYERVVTSRPAAGAAPLIQPVEPAEQAAGRPTAFVIQALDQRAPALAAAIARADLHRGYVPFEYFLERLSNDPARLERLNSEPELAATALDLFEHSPYFAEDLIRRPESMDELARVSIPLIQDEPPPHDATELRRWFRRAILRIEAESICRSHPIFETLDKTSRLADTVIARAYEIAIADVRSSNPPENPGYQPGNQMSDHRARAAGMREFDLGSDADLVFVLPDSDASEMVFWTRVAERIVHLITAYTGEGVLFAVDERLRPNGTAGPLVQTESAVTEYFANAAEAWEGITYMKSLAVAGDLETRRAVFARAAAGRLAAVRAGRAFPGRSARDASASGEGAGSLASLEGRPRRLLRYRFSADVPAPEKRGRVLHGAEHTRPHRSSGTDGPLEPPGRPIPERCGHLLSRAGSRPPRDHGTRREPLAGIGRAVGRAQRAAAPLDADPAVGLEQNPLGDARRVRPVFRIAEGKRGQVVGLIPKVHGFRMSASRETTPSWSVSAFAIRAMDAVLRPAHRVAMCRILTLRL